MNLKQKFTPTGASLSYQNYTFLLELLKVNQYDTLWHDQNTLDPDDMRRVFRGSKQKTRSSLSELYSDYNYKQIGEHSKLRSYVRFKSDFEMEKYLQIDNVPHSYRKLYCSFRISCHDLEIERGRYAKVPKPPEDRICKICSLQPETEEHFLLYCPKFKDFRCKMFSKVFKLDPFSINIDHSQRFIYLISNKNTDIIQTVMTFLNDAYKERSCILRGQ